MAVPTDIEGFRALALKTFVEKTSDAELDQVMLDLGYTRDEIVTAREAGKNRLVYTVTVTSPSRTDAQGRDYIRYINSRIRETIGTNRGETVTVEYAFNPERAAA